MRRFVARCTAAAWSEIDSQLRMFGEVELVRPAANWRNRRPVAGHFPCRPIRPPAAAGERLPSTASVLGPSHETESQVHQPPSPASSPFWAKEITALLRASPPSRDGRSISSTAAQRSAGASRGRPPWTALRNRPDPERRRPRKRGARPGGRTTRPLAQQLPTAANQR